MSPKRKWRMRKAEFKEYIEKIKALDMWKIIVEK